MDNMNTMYNAPNQINVNQPGTDPAAQGDELYNPTDSQSYSVNETNQDGSVNVTNPQTNQQEVIPANDVQNFVPQVKSKLEKKAWAEINVPELKFDDLQDLGEGIVLLGAGGDISDWVSGVTSVLAEEGVIPVNDIMGTWKQYGVLTTTGGRTDLVMIPNEGVFDWGKGAMWRLKFGDCSWISDYITKYEDQHRGGPIVSSLADQEINKILSGPTSFASKRGNAGGSNKDNRTFNNSSFQKKKRAKTMANDWKETRDMLMVMQAEDKKKKASFASRQDIKLREMGKVADVRDPISGLPINGEKDDDIEVGLTEFPFDEKRDSGKGYEDYTMKEMDDKNIEDRQHFNNEVLLPIQKMRRNELKDYIKGLPEAFDDKEERYASEVASAMGIKPVLSRLQDELIKIRPISVREFTSITKASSIDELDNALGNYHTSKVEEVYRGYLISIAEDVAKEEEVKDTEVIEKPVQYKEIAIAPKTNVGYEEPEAINPASGKAKEAITKLQAVQTNIKEIQAELKKKTDPIMEMLNDAGKPFKERLTAEQALLKTYFDMVYDQLSKTSDKVGHYEDDIYAAVERESVAAKAATLTEVIKKAKTAAPEILEALNKVKSLIENERTTAIVEKTIYKYPIKGPQEKKIVSSDELEALLGELSAAAKELETLNAAL